MVYYQKAYKICDQVKANFFTDREKKNGKLMLQFNFKKEKLELLNCLYSLSDYILIINFDCKNKNIF